MSDQTQDRTPAPDEAEDHAFFPSPYSLSQYTAEQTDFDGLVTDQTYAGDRWRILVIATDERYMRMQDGSFFSTGNHPVETLLPLHHMLEAGYAVDVVTLSGEPAKFEWWAFPRKDEAVNATWKALGDAFKSPRKLADLAEDGVGDYAAVFIPGGHGAMNGLPFSLDVQRTLDAFLDANRLIITLCHGPAALLAGGVGRERNPFSGYEIVAFPDALDFGANLGIGYLPAEMPWKLGETLEAAGIRVSNEQMTGATTRDRNLLTGDSPLAANQLGKDAVQALLADFAD